jgi:hypothetical protein
MQDRTLGNRSTTRECKLANYDSGILGIMLLSKQASEAALYAGGVVHLPELPAVPPAELSKFHYHNDSYATSLIKDVVY